jgi:hypothetical protein
VREKKLPNDRYGDHSDEPGKPPKKRPGHIRISKKLRKRPRLYCEVLLHEGLHEYAPYLEEWAVQEIADKLECLLNRSGKWTLRD